MIIAFYILVLIFSVILHEVSHGLAALSMGDTTARDAGRLTPNPLKHLDLFGSLLLPLLSYVLGGFIFGYAKPVPYNPLNLNDRKYGPAKVALAGPLSNLLLAILTGIVLRFLPVRFDTSLLPTFLSIIVRTNLVLCCFNLIPIQPLDGHWLLMTFLPSRFIEIKYFLSRYGVFIFILFLVFFSKVLTPLINFLFGVIVGR